MRKGRKEKRNIAVRLVAVLICLLAGIVKAGAAFDIPTIYITTADSSAIVSRDYWKENTKVEIVLPDGKVAFRSSRVSVRARGNSTLGKPKKPYALKLRNERGLLGMAKSRRWVLLANFMDHSLMRNRLALEIARRTCLEWTPDCRFVDVVVNGTMQGCYLLCEQIRVENGRLDLDKAYGFMVEMDNYSDGECRFRTQFRNLPVKVKFPKNPSASMIARIGRCLNGIETMFYAETGSDAKPSYGKFMDLDTFADWWIVHELAQNAEPNGPRSCFMYKDRWGLLKAGPVWDFDLAFIPVGLDAGGDIRPSRLRSADVIPLNGDSLYNASALWFDRLLKDPHFVGILKARWKMLEPKFRDLLSDIDEWETLIAPSAEADERQWRGQDPARFDTYETFHASVANLKRVYEYRMGSLARLIDGM